LKNHEFEIYSGRHFVELFGVCCGFLAPIYQITFGNDTDYKIVEDKHNS